MILVTEVIEDLCSVNKAESVCPTFVITDVSKKDRRQAVFGYISKSI